MAINLSKSGDTHRIDLTKPSAGGSLNVHANLNWSQEAQSKGFFSKLLGGNDAPDLDLGCMFELNDGQKGVIQPLGGYFGSKTQSPFIFLDKDDRSGAASDGENMFVFKPELIKRVMFFAMIYKGATNFQSVKGRMFFKISNGETVTLELNNPDGVSGFCAAATLTNNGGDFTIRKEEKYFSGHQYADQHYGFGFDWVAGSK
jgi:tellurite resistance protein TerA